MAKKISLVHEKDVIPTYFAGRESVRMITKEREGSEHFSVHMNWIRPRTQWLSQFAYYPDADELVYLLEGDVQVLINDEVRKWPVGAAIYIPAGCRWKVRPNTDARVLVVKAPPTLRSEFATRTKDHPHLTDLVQIEPENALKNKRSPKG